MAGCLSGKGLYKGLIILNNKLATYWVIKVAQLVLPSKVQNRYMSQNYASSPFSWLPG